ncbi:MAG: PIG-L deacetylase family protein [Candidatus Dormibacteria bacterium]
MRRSLVAVLAHPDDELLIACTLAGLSAQGVETVLVCATDGGGGIPGSDPNEVRALRARELAESAEKLGLSRVIRLEEEAGSAACHMDQGNYRELATEAHSSLIKGVLARTDPEVVVTFGADGITGHPTHTAVGEIATAAARGAGVPRILHIAVTRDQVRTFLAAVEEAAPGTVTEDIAAGALKRSVAAHEVSFAVSCGALLPVKMAAIACHRSQGGGGGPLDVIGKLQSECFVIVGGPPRHVPSDDLFDGLP